MEYKIEKILSRVTELTDNLEIVNREITSLQKEAEAIKQELKVTLKDFH